MNKQVVKHRSFLSMVQAIYRLLPKKWQAMKRGSLEKDHRWHSFCEWDVFGVTLSLENDRWGLSDGDPICFWCGNTFVKEYPFGTKPPIIARRVLKELRKQARNKELLELKDE